MKFSQVARRLSSTFPNQVATTEHDYKPVLKLNRTLSGSHCGSLVYEVNRLVILDALEKLEARSEGILVLDDGFSASILAIVGDVTVAEYELIYNCLESLGSYPCLDVAIWSQLEEEEAYSALESWQLAEITRDLEDLLGSWGKEGLGHFISDQELSELVRVYLRENCDIFCEGNVAYYSYDSSNVEDILAAITSF